MGKIYLAMWRNWLGEPGSGSKTWRRKQWQQMFAFWRNSMDRKRTLRNIPVVWELQKSGLTSDLLHFLATGTISIASWTELLGLQKNYVKIAELFGYYFKQHDNEFISRFQCFENV